MSVDFETIRFIGVLDELARRSSHDFVDVDYLQKHDFMRETCKDWVVYDKESGDVVWRVDRDGNVHFYDEIYPGMRFGILRSAVGQRLKVMVTVATRGDVSEVVVVEDGRWYATELTRFKG